MSTKVSNSQTEPAADAAAQLDVLGDECARTILVATCEGPKTAKELTGRTDSSSATVYRRINNLLEANLIAECVRFDDDGSHTTAYESTIEELCIRIDVDGISVARPNSTD